MKITVWTVTSCIPNECDPVIPSVFATKKEADTYLDEVMRDEWSTMAPIDDETGQPMPYPGTWEEAQVLIVEDDSDESWGKWVLHSHDIEIAVPEMLAALKRIANPSDIGAAEAVLAVIAKAEG